MRSARVHPRWESENGRMATVEGLPSYNIFKIRAKLDVSMFLRSSYKQISREGQRQRESEMRHGGVDF